MSTLHGQGWRDGLRMARRLVVQRRRHVRRFMELYDRGEAPTAECQIQDEELSFIAATLKKMERAGK